MERVEEFYVGVDPSMRSTGECLRDGGTLRVRTSVIDPKAKSAGALQNALSLLRAAKSRAKGKNIVLAIESQHFDQYTGFKAVLEVATAYKGVFESAGARVVEVSPATWKSIVYGKNYPKDKKTKRGIEEYLSLAKLAMGVEFNNPDEADAAAILIAAERKAGL